MYNPYYSNYSSGQKGILAGASFMDSVMRSYANALGMMANIDSAKTQREMQQQQLDLSMNQFELDQKWKRKMFRQGVEQDNISNKLERERLDYAKDQSDLGQKQKRTEARNKAAIQSRDYTNDAVGNYADLGGKAFELHKTHTELTSQIDALRDRATSIKNEGADSMQNAKLLKETEEQLERLTSEQDMINGQIEQVKGLQSYWGGQVESLTGKKFGAPATQKNAAPESGYGESRDVAADAQQNNYGPRLGNAQKERGYGTGGEAAFSPVQTTEGSPNTGSMGSMPQPKADKANVLPNPVYDMLGVTHGDPSIKAGGRTTEEGHPIFTSDKDSFEKEYAYDAETGSIYEVGTFKNEYGVEVSTSGDAVTPDLKVVGDYTAKAVDWQNDEEYSKMAEELESGDAFNWNHSFLGRAVDAVKETFTPNWLYTAAGPDSFPSPTEFTSNIAENLLEMYSELDFEAYNNGKPLPGSIIDLTVSKAKKGLEKAKSGGEVDGDQFEVYTKALDSLKRDGRLSLTREFKGEPVTVSVPLDKSLHDVISRAKAATEGETPDIHKYITGLFYFGHTFTGSALEEAKGRQIGQVNEAVSALESARLAAKTVILDQNNNRVYASPEEVVKLIAGNILDIEAEKLVRPRPGMFNFQNKKVKDPEPPQENSTKANKFRPSKTKGNPYSSYFGTQYPVNSAYPIY
jgi:hypothetical protein